MTTTSVPPRRSARLNSQSGLKRARPDDNTVDSPPKKRGRASVKQELVSEAQVKPATARPIQNVVVPKAKPTKKSAKATTPKPKLPPKPSKSELKAQRKEQWEDWCERHHWDTDPTFEPEIGCHIMHSGDAASYFTFQDEDLGVIPHSSIPGYHFLRPIRSYRYQDLLNLAYRKEAFFKGIAHALDEPGAETEETMLTAGQILLHLAMKRLGERYKKRTEKMAQEGKLKAGARRERKGPNLFVYTGEESSKPRIVIRRRCLLPSCQCGAHDD